MTRRSLFFYWSMVLATGGLTSPTARGQAPEAVPPIYSAVEDSPMKIDGLAFMREPTAPGQDRAARLRLPGFICGFLHDPLEIDNDDSSAVALEQVPEDDWTGLKLDLGNYNPAFDLRRPGYPIRPGFWKLHAQVQVLGSEAGSVCLSTQALTPAGPEFGGVCTGTTIMAPAFSWFQDLGAGSALQGYFGKNFQMNDKCTDHIGRGFHGGLAFQCPVPGLSTGNSQGLLFFMQAMGYYRFDMAHADGSPPMIMLYPGLHWQLSDSCWLSVSASRSNLIMCSWQF
jgi:hypothetical protein